MEFQDTPDHHNISHAQAEGQVTAASRTFPAPLPSVAAPSLDPWPRAPLASRLQWCAGLLPRQAGVQAF